MKGFTKLASQLRGPIAFLLTLVMVIGVFPFTGTVLSAAEPPPIGAVKAVGNGWSSTQKDTRAEVGPAPAGFTPISTEAQLRSILTSSTASIRRGSYWLMNDIDLGGVPIHGTAVQIFEGVFEGNNRIISGLSEATATPYMGLFKKTNKATIRNLSVVVHSKGVMGKSYVGGLVGSAENGTQIVNCHVIIDDNSFVAGSTSSKLGYNIQALACYDIVGGLVGHVLNSSVRESSVVLAGESYIKGAYYVGGLVGYAYNSSITDSLVVHEGVSGSSGIRGNEKVGGLIGYTVLSRIFNSHVYGSNWNIEDYHERFNRKHPEPANVVAVRADGACYGAGGLIGLATSTSVIEQCSSYVNVAGYRAGGLVGTAICSSTIRNAYARGLVSGTLKVGGLIGYADCSVTIQNTYAAGPVIGKTYVNAWIGYHAIPKTKLLGMSFFDNQVASQASQVNGIPRGESTEKMMIKGTFTAAPGNWNFETIWRIDEHLNYPHFIGMPTKWILSAEPVIFEIFQGDREVFGLGDSEGALIIVTWPDGSTSETLVDGNNRWSVDVPNGITLVQGNEVKATQTEPDKVTSPETVQTVRHTQAINPWIEVDYQNLTDTGGENRPDDEIRYIITVGNDGVDQDGYLRDIVITDKLPAGVTVVAEPVMRLQNGTWVTLGNGSSFNYSEGTFTINLGDSIGKDESVTIGFKVTIDPDTYDSIITNTVQAAGNQYINDNLRGPFDISATSDLDIVKNQVTVTFDMNYSAGTRFAQTVIVGDTVTIPDEASDYTRSDQVDEGYAWERQTHVFVGWSLNPRTLVTYDFNSEVTESFVLYAIWEERYTVRYWDDFNQGGEVPIDNNVYRRNQPAFAMSNTGSLVRQGHIFSGWRLGHQMMGIAVPAGSALIVTGNIDLYTNWVVHMEPDLFSVFDIEIETFDAGIDDLEQQVDTASEQEDIVPEQVDMISEQDSIVLE